MKPIEFNNQNVVFAGDQDEYNNLPAFKGPDGEAISCWRLSFFERLWVLFSGKIWLRTMTFNGPLQPVMIQLGDPWKETEIVKKT